MPEQGDTSASALSISSICFAVLDASPVASDVVPGHEQRSEVGRLPGLIEARAQRGNLSAIPGEKQDFVGGAWSSTRASFDVGDRPGRGLER